MGSGKTTIAKSICTDINARYLSFSSYIMSIANEKNMESHSREVLQNIGNKLVSSDITSFFTNFLEYYQVSNTTGNGIIVIDGLRHKLGLDVFKSILYDNNIKLIYVKTKPQIRLNRLLNIYHDPLIIEKYCEHEVEKEIIDLEPLADLVIDGELPVVENMQHIKKLINDASSPI